jgi:DNA-nicking Smr family endonuclease
MKRRGKKAAIKLAIEPAKVRAAESTIDDADTALFRDAVRGVAPLAPSDKVPLTTEHPRPVPRQSLDDGQTAPVDSLSDHISLEMEPGDEWAFVRPGMPRQTLRRLRRGYWKIEAQLDLHGLTRDEARPQLAAFLDASRLRGARCVRIIHGKGLSSRNHEPVLKARVGSWLAQRSEVLAFSQARPEDGGSGAVLVLLKAPAHGAYSEVA